VATVGLQQQAAETALPALVAVFGLYLPFR
jgi:hypothetical protein